MRSLVALDDLEELSRDLGGDKTGVCEVDIVEPSKSLAVELGLQQLESMSKVCYGQTKCQNFETETKKNKAVTD